MARIQAHPRVVEIFQVAACHVHRADRDADSAIVEAIEIDHALQRFDHRPRGVETGARRARRGERILAEPAARLVEAALAFDHRPPRFPGIEPGARVLADAGEARLLSQRGRRQQVGLGNGFPEFAQRVHATFGRVAGDQRGVECADGNAGDPVGHDAGFMQALVDAGLVGAERAATLQYQGDVFRQLRCRRALTARRRGSGFDLAGALLHCMLGGCMFGDHQSATACTSRG